MIVCACLACLIPAVALTSHAADTSLSTLRCGNEIIYLGDRTFEVRKACGEPDQVDRWQERRLVRDYPDPFAHRRREYERSRHPIVTEKLVTVEEWTYNLGPSKFIRYLIFENGLLQEIHLGGYGD